MKISIPRSYRSFDDRLTNTGPFSFSDLLLRSSHGYVSFSINNDTSTVAAFDIIQIETSRKPFSRKMFDAKVFHGHGSFKEENTGVLFIFRSCVHFEVVRASASFFFQTGIYFSWWNLHSGSNENKFLTGNVLHSILSQV